MAIADGQEKDVKQEFARRHQSFRTKVVLLVILFALVAAGQRGGRIWGIPSAIAFVLFAVVVGLTGRSARGDARCPACGASLRWNMRVSSCWRCGAALR